MIDRFIGGTPTVRLERIVEPGMAEVWVKLEGMVGSSRVDLQACKLEYSIVSPK